ncbi:MFS transporter [Paenibacillus sp. 481]|nr:MFS transporter [Paenibacillus sp. 481]
MRLRRMRTAALWVVGIAVFTDMLIYGLIVPILPHYSSMLGASQSAIGLLFGSYAAALLLATPIMGVWSDRVGRRIPMIVGLFGLGAATLLFGFSEQFEWLIVARVLQGIAAAATWTAGLALLADLYPAEQRGRAMGIALSGQAAGMLLGPTIGGWLYEWGGYTLPFIVAALLAFIDGGLRIFLLREREPSLSTASLADGASVPFDASTKPKMGSLLRKPQMLLLTGTIVIGAGISASLEPTLPLYLHQQFSSTAATIGMLFAIPTIAYGVCTPIIGGLSLRIGGTRTSIIGMLIAAVVLPCLTITNALAVVCLLLALLGISFSLILTPTLPALASLADDHGSHAYGLTFAVYNIAYSAGMFIGPTASGWLTEQYTFLWALIVLGFLSAFYALLLILKSKKSSYTAK